MTEVRKKAPVMQKVFMLFVGLIYITAPAFSMFVGLITDEWWSGMDCRMAGYWQNRPVYNRTKELGWAPVHVRATRWVDEGGRRAVFDRTNA